MQNFDEFMEVVRKIRKSCPWDKVQTHESLKPYLISETNELLEGIDRLKTQNDSENLCEEEGLFTIEDVIDGISSKMQFRHPKIFVPEDETMTSLSWDQLKEIEKSRKTKKL